MTSPDTQTRSTPPVRRRTVKAALVAAVAALTVVATPALAPAGATATATAGPSAAKLQRALDAVVAAGSPGAAVLVRDGNKTVRLDSGKGNLDPASPMRAKERTRMGGLTKTFTATVVLQMVGEGKLGLGDTLGRWLPGAVPDAAAVTVRQLLNHTSGIYDFSGDPAVLRPYAEGDLTRLFDLDQGIQVAADHGSVFTPGSGLLYSNTNYVLLAKIVEAAGGKTFAAELKDRLLRPLHLDRTSLRTSSAISGSYTHGFMTIEQPPLQDVTAFSPSLMGASGAILSTTDDVATFYRALLKGQLLKPAQMAAMKTIDPAATGGIPDSGILGGGWGLGLLRETFPCGEAWGHDSEIPGFITATWNSPHGSRQVVAVVNSSFGHDDPVSVALRKVLVTAYCG